eukprot:TRINITY_DN74856_c0_g1_i1.p1 TRINITY_DN74856_c0_g1~~TRINITY_DN74856_c0_g1_i1.p1  ORF type:complete len:625 (-),score=56.51 TRINITY_DN74856_c0_g1_i1:84-1958(-)
MGGFVGTLGCVARPKEGPEVRGGLLGMLDNLQGRCWLRLILSFLLIDTVAMSYAAVTHLPLPMANIHEWNTLPQNIANLHYIFCWILMIDAALRLFAFVVFAALPKKRKIQVKRGIIGSIVKFITEAQETVYDTLEEGIWGDQKWQWFVTHHADIVNTVMEFMVPAVFDFLISGIALLNATPDRSWLRLSALTAYIGKVVIPLQLITWRVRRVMFDDRTHDHTSSMFTNRYDWKDIEKKYAKKADRYDPYVPWVLPVIAFSLGIAFFLSNLRTMSYVCFSLGGLFIMRGHLRGRPYCRRTVSSLVNLTIVAVAFAQLVYGCAEYDGALGFQFQMLAQDVQDLQGLNGGCCSFPPPPAIQPKDSFICDHSCDGTDSRTGCLADGINLHCRFCGVAGTPSCGTAWLGNFHDLFNMIKLGGSHDTICSNFRLLGMLIILIQSVEAIVEGMFFGEVAFKLKDEQQMSSVQRWTLAGVADTLYQSNGGYETLCYDVAILLVLALQQNNVQIPILAARLARFYVYQTRDLIPYLVYSMWPHEMVKLIKILKHHSAKHGYDSTYYEDRADWLPRGVRLASGQDSSEEGSWLTCAGPSAGEDRPLGDGMETRIEAVPDHHTSRTFFGDKVAS